MTSPLGLSAAFAYVMVALVLAGALAYGKLSELARLVIATFAFACAWLITAALDAMRAPDWTMVLGGAVVVVSILAVSATLHLWTRADDLGEENRGYRGDDGEGGLRRHRPDSPQPGGGGSDPGWWPEFERRLAVYVAEREAEKRTVAGAKPPRVRFANERLAVASGPSSGHDAPRGGLAPGDSLPRGEQYQRHRRKTAVHRM